MSCGGHGHGHCDGHSHGDSAEDCSAKYSLYQKIDLENLQCLNEAREGSCKAVFRAWDQRLNHAEAVQSDCDEELLFNIPFSGIVRVKGVVIIGGEAGAHPSKLRLFKDKPFMSFDQAGATCDQEIELHPDPQGVIEYELKPTKFGSLSHLSIHIPANFGDPSTEVYWIGLRGDFLEGIRPQVVIANYEITPQLSDHQVKDQLEGQSYIPDCQ